MTGRRIRVLELRSVTGPGGGPEKTILLGAAQTDRDRYDVRVCYIRDARDQQFDLDTRARALGVDYVEVRERHSLDLAVLAPLAAIVRDGGFDIVHAHDYKTDAIALYLRRRTGVIPLATAHGWTGQSPRERRLYYPVDRWLLARFPRVIAVSSEIRTTLLAAGAKSDRVTVILNGIDPAAFRRQPDRAAGVRAALGVAPDEILVGAVGRVERQKRFDLLLEATARVASSVPRLRLAIVGDGSLLPALREQARALDLTDRVIFTGHRTDIVDLHSAFDLFVQASEYEGTPNAVLEAMALGTPLVATDAGGTAELFTDGREGLLVPRHDAAALAAAMIDALSHPDRTREMAAAARQRIETVLSFEARTRRLEAIYAELAHA